MTSSLDDLASCLRGLPPEGTRWPKVLQLANQSLVTASLGLALENAPEIPEAVAAFLADVLRRNHERNAALLEQLGEVLRTLNGAGIEPVLLKGAAGLAEGGRARREGRILCDLDVLVQPVEVDRAIAALSDAGYRQFTRRRGAELHAVADLFHEDRRGMIDLHQRPPGPPGMAESARLRLRDRRLDIQGGYGWIPDSSTQIYLLTLHDQFHDGDYWSGRLNLRHLIDASDLIMAPGGVNWTRLDELVASRLVQHGLDTLLLGATWLTGGRIRPDRPWSLAARLQHARRRFQVRAPFAIWPLAAATVMIEAPNIMTHRRVDREGCERLFGPHDGAALRPTLEDRLTRLRNIFSAPVAGKL